jgi:hypothetical protein
MLPSRMLRYRYRSPRRTSEYARVPALRVGLLAVARGTRPKAGSSNLKANRYNTVPPPGCGATSHGTSQNISCATIPAGALVRSADGSTCSTPCTVSLKRKKDDVLTIEKEGYETVTLPVRSALSKASAGNILLPGGLICWSFDVVSGGGYHLVPEHVDLTLKLRAEAPEQAVQRPTGATLTRLSQPISEETLN